MDQPTYEEMEEITEAEQRLKLESYVERLEKLQKDAEKESAKVDSFTTAKKIKLVCEALATVLTEKNKRYGDSALYPVNIFNKLNATEALYVRADDKISRIKNSDVLRKNDISDLLGYLILICIANGWLDFSDQID